MSKDSEEADRAASHSRHAERPEFTTRDDVVQMLGEILGGILPADLHSPLVDYLVDKGVLVKNHRPFVEAVSLPPGMGDLGTFPPDARRHLHHALAEHAVSPDAAVLLLHAIPNEGTAGFSITAARRPTREQVLRVLWDRSHHVESLRGFGVDAGRAFEVLSFLMAGLPAPPPGPTPPDERSEEQKRLDTSVISAKTVRAYRVAMEARAEEHRRSLLAAFDTAAERSSVGSNGPGSEAGRPSAENEVPAPDTDGEPLVTITDISKDTGIPYSTLSSRRGRAQPGGPKSQGVDECRRMLFRRSDWMPLIEQIRQTRRTGQRSG